MLRNYFIFCIIITLLTSCAAGPDYVRPRVDVPAKFKEMPKSWKIAKPSDTYNRGEWWLKIRI